ncbi:response regulator [Silvanigrella aquatica]|uniref:histidine kinase n=1 Tax=Silvanigrella aquatica TaxID=1915309 RepID=A0A1L4D2G4_9BACT|nr:response regulator [Silvanigrella aquatica]APJ04388.1 hypothetical protein AXG55_10915 [Silvanigrella aquatica]
MFQLFEHILQNYSIKTRRNLIFCVITAALFIGFLPNYNISDIFYKKIETIIFIGNIITSISLISFFTLRKNFSKKLYSSINYFSQLLIILILIAQFSINNVNYLNNLKEIDAINNLLNFFIWNSLVLNISLIYTIEKNNNYEFNTKKISEPSQYIIYIILLIIPILNLYNIDYKIILSLAYIIPISKLITFLENTPKSDQKNEFIFLILFISLFFCSFQNALILNNNPNIFLNEISIFITLSILSYRNHLKLASEFHKIHEISIILARKMGELSLMHIEAQKSEIAKQNFLATMSHEIRTPVNGIIGHAELLSDTEITEEQQRLLSMITISSNNLMKLINEVLDLPNLISGHIILSKENISVSSLVESVIDVVSPKSFEKGLDLTYFIEPSVPIEFIGDQKRIGQILLNLCNNALKFTQKGEVFIGVTQIDQPDENHAELLFEVKDTGIGIPATKIKMLFKAYSQTDASISRKFGGTGLGLAISAQLIELMKGRIWVESVIGKGTRFLFTLNCEIPKEPSSHQLDVSHFQGLKCLAISENPTMRYILGRRFKQWKMITKIVSNFEEAQNTIGIEEFRILIVDIVSESKKAALFLKVNYINPSGRIPSIALISLGKNATPDLHLIANETITKPLKTEILAKTITKIIRQKETTKNVPLTIQPQNEIPSNEWNKLIPPEAAKKLKILVAEDNPVNQKLIKSVLIKMGFTPTLVENGKLAVEEEQKEKFDLILMDLQMPEMDGLNATKNIIINSINRKRPRIIALTANAMPGDKEKCLDAGMDDYISKPIQFQILSEKISQWVPIENIPSQIQNNIEDKNMNIKNTDQNKTDNLKILVAEDNPVNQKLIISILKKLGFTATLVENGALAFEAATKEKYDIIIMDLQMPVMDGLEASRNIKASDKINPKPAIIALTANAMEGDKERCLAAGMDDYMTKPIQIKILEENIKKWGTKS